MQPTTTTTTTTPFPYSAGDVVSEGTHLAEALIPRLSRALETIRDAGLSLSERSAELLAEGADTDPDSEAADELVSDLFDALSEACPPWLYFGAVEGDGACFGFWLSDEGEEAIEALEAAQALLHSPHAGCDEQGFTLPTEAEWLAFNYEQRVAAVDVSVRIPYTGGDDTVAEANRRALASQYGEPGDDAWGFSGGVTVSLTLALDDVDQARSVVETIEGLESYPLIDDEALSEVEHEREQEAWESDIRSDFCRSVRERTLVDLDEANADDVLGLFLKACEVTSACWEHADGSAWINVDPLADHVAATHTSEALRDIEGAQWDDGEEPTSDDCDRARAHFERKNAEDLAARDMRYMGHTLDFRLRWASTLHPARSVATCVDCGARAVVNVRPAPGAPEQRTAYGRALDERCSRPHVTSKPEGTEGPYWNVVSGSDVLSAWQSRTDAEAAAKAARSAN